MEQPQEEWKDIIGRRLITRAEATDQQLVKQDEEPVPSFDRAEDDDIADRPSQPDQAIELAITDAKLSPTTFAKVEKSLASLGFFTPSSRRIKDQRIKRISFTREIDGKRVEVTAEILPTIFGLPVTADQDKYLALQKMITDRLQAEGKITNPIRFTSAELLRLLNKRVRTGKNYKDIGEWLKVMTATAIVSNGVVYIAGKKRYVNDTFHVFDRAVSIGKELDDGSMADANFVWLSSWQLENINQNYLLPVDLQTYQQLKNHIAKALVPLLQIWLFASHKAGSFEKRYEELCEILNLQKYRAPSLISRQLKPSLDELVYHGYLEKWRIEKTSDRKAYKVILFHGPKFHRDRRKRIEQKSHAAGESQVIVAESEPLEPSLPELGKLEHAQEEHVARAADRPNISVTTREEVPRESEPVVAVENKASDLQSVLVDELAIRGLMPSTAIKLLASIVPGRLGDVRDYIEYWDAVKLTKEVGPGLLHDLIKNGDPLPSHFESSRQREARRLADERRERLHFANQSLEVAYEEYSRAAVDRFIAAEFPQDEFMRRVEAKKLELSSQFSFWEKVSKPEFSESIATAAVRSEIAKQVSLLSFADFCRQEGPRILAVYQIDPAELGISSLPSPQPEATSQGGGGDKQFSSHQHQESASEPAIDPIPPHDSETGL